MSGVSLTLPSFNRTINRLRKLRRLRLESMLDSVGEAGLAALRESTPIDTGEAAASWYFTKDGQDGRYTITWNSTDVVGHIPLVVLLDSGHGTGTGGYVPGLHFIGPAVKPIYQKFRRSVEAEVRRK